MVAFDVTVFPNGEDRVRLVEDVSGKDVAVRLDVTDKPDRDLTLFLLKVDALREHGAKKITAVVPYLPYSLQNRHFDGEPVSARVAARMISQSGADEVMTLDLHEAKIAEFFTIPCRNLSPLALFAEYFKGKGIEVVATPDHGSEARGKDLAAEMGGLPVVAAEKERDLVTTKIVRMTLPEKTEVKGKTVLIADDLLNTGGTVVKLAGLLRERGAKKIIFGVTHILPVAGNLEKVLKAVDAVVTTESIPLEVKSEKVTILPLAKMLL